MARHLDRAALDAQAALYAQAVGTTVHELIERLHAMPDHPAGLDAELDPECPLSELPASQCGCRHHGGALPDVETLGQPLEARYPGACVRCDGEIHPGQMIVRVADDTEARAAWAHVGTCR